MHAPIYSSLVERSIRFLYSCFNCFYKLFVSQPTRFGMFTLKFFNYSFTNKVSEIPLRSSVNVLLINLSFDN
jgi:hypothetical protein